MRSAPARRRSSLNGRRRARHQQRKYPVVIPVARSGAVESGETSYRPSSGGQGEWCCRQQGSALFAELNSPGGVECCDVAAGGAYPEGEGLPPRFEGRVLDGDRERSFLNRAESGFSEELGEMTFARSGEVRLSFAVTIELACRVPKEPRVVLRRRNGPRRRRPQLPLGGSPGPSHANPRRGHS